MCKPYRAIALLFYLIASLFCSGPADAVPPLHLNPSTRASENAARVDSAHADSLSPRAALLRSALLPGWGQLYNGKPYKAAFFAAVSAGFLGVAVAEQIALNDAQSPFESEERAARRNTRILFFALSVTFAALDAYVDAHLADLGANWNAEMRGDGALLTLHVNLPP